MEPPGGRDSRFNLGYSMNLLSGETPPDIYNPNLGRPSSSLQQLSPRHTMVSSACGAQSLKGRDVCYDERGMTSQGLGLDCGVNEVSDDTYSALQAKKSPPSNGKKTKGRVKIKMEYIENKLRRYTTFSKRKTGIMKKAYELSTLTGTQVMLLVASETGHVYTFATRKLQPMITSEAGKALIQTCLNSPDPPAGSSAGDQRMSATGFEETELTYNISDEDSKEENNMSQEESSDSSEDELPEANSEEGMGCSAAKNLTVEPLDGTKVTTLSNGVEVISRKLSTPRKPSDLPAIEGVDPQTEFLESANVNNVHQTPHGLSFDIPLEEGENESIIRKHPPRRFQKLEDQQTSPTLSLVRLQEKLGEAEVRRQQILQQRIQSAQFKKVLKKQSSVYSISENGISHLEVPEDKPDTPFIKSSGDISNNNVHVIPSN